MRLPKNVGIRLNNKVQSFAIRGLIGLLTGFGLVFGCDSMLAATVEGHVNLIDSPTPV